MINILEKKLGKNFKDNLLTAEEMRKEIVKLQKAGKRVVFTNGVFDILHIGHLTYLEEAGNLGDVLVVGVNSDASVKVNKGDKRPINSEKNRAYVLLGTKFVDYAVIFDEKTPEKLLDVLKPDVHVKGGDYKKEDLPETKIVEGNGGEVKILSFVDNVSTTQIINKIIEAYKN
jgi:bifunctional protein rfaE, domain II